MHPSALGIPHPTPSRPLADPASPALHTSDRHLAGTSDTTDALEQVERHCYSSECLDRGLPFPRCSLLPYSVLMHTKKRFPDYGWLTEVDLPAISQSDPGRLLFPGLRSRSALTAWSFLVLCLSLSLSILHHRALTLIPLVK
jgi:hypothetical protein